MWPLQNSLFKHFARIFLMVKSNFDMGLWNLPNFIPWFGCLMLGILNVVHRSVLVARLHCRANTENIALSWEIFNQAILIELILINFVTNSNNWVASSPSLLLRCKIKCTPFKACSSSGEIRSWNLPFRHFWMLSIQWLSENGVLFEIDWIQFSTLVSSKDRNEMEWNGILLILTWYRFSFQYFERLLRISFQLQPIKFFFNFSPWFSFEFEFSTHFRFGWQRLPMTFFAWFGRKFPNGHQNASNDMLILSFHNGGVPSEYDLCSFVGVLPAYWKRY